MTLGRNVGVCPKSIVNFFKDNSDFENNVFLLNSKFGQGKTWVLKILEVDFYSMNKDKINWINYSAFHYLDEKDLFCDIYKSMNTKRYTRINETDNTGDFAKAVTSKIEPITNFFSDKSSRSDSIGKTVAANDDILNLDDKFYNFAVEKPTIVVIDDLDRIKEDKLWKILMFLSVFENKKNVLFILAGSSEYLQSILSKNYSLSGGESFLNKFVGKEFNLPAPSFTELIINSYDLDIGNNLKSIINFGISNYVKVFSYRQLKTTYLTKLKYIAELKSFIELSENKQKYMILCFFILSELKLNHKLFWTRFLKENINLNNISHQVNSHFGTLYNEHNISVHQEQTSNPILELIKIYLDIFSMVTFNKGSINDPLLPDFSKFIGTLVTSPHDRSKIHLSVHFQNEFYTRFNLMKTNFESFEWLNGINENEFDESLNKMFIELIEIISI